MIACAQESERLTEEEEREMERLLEEERARAQANATRPMLPQGMPAVPTSDAIIKQV
jgi:hypothetical protein